MGEEFYKTIVQESSYGYAYNHIIEDDEGRVCDFRFIEVNEAFSLLIGKRISDIQGNTIKQLFPSIIESSFNWIETFGRVAKGKRKIHFVQLFEPLSRYFSVRAYSFSQGFFITHIVDVSFEVRKLQLYENCIAFAPVLFVVSDKKGDILLTNEHSLTLLGYQREFLLHSNIFNFIHPDDIDDVVKHVRSLEDGGSLTGCIHRFLHANGTHKTLQWNGHSKDGLFYSVATDITETLSKDRVRQRELDTMTLFFNQDLIGMFMMMLDEPIVWDDTIDKQATMEYVFSHQHLTRANRAFYDQYRSSKKDMEGWTPNEFFSHSRKEFFEIWKTFFDEGKLHTETCGKRLDGEDLWIIGDYTCLYDSKGRIVGHFGMQLDISDRKRSENALKESEQKYRLIAEHASDVIWVYVVEKKCFTYISPSVQKFLGISSDEMMQLPFQETIYDEDRLLVSSVVQKNIALFVEQHLKTHQFVVEVRHVHKDGRIFFSEVSINIRRNEFNKIELLGVSRDISQRKEYEKRIIQLSYYDQLTNIYNRRYIDEHVASFTKESRLPMVLTVCDVNGLKITNDVFGHQIGDLLLQRCATILSNVCQSRDILARIGGDEFIMVCFSTSLKEVQERIKDVQQLLLDQKIGKTHISVSFGSVEYIQGESFEETFNRAEDVMYRKKLLESASYKHDLIKLLLGGLYDKGEIEENHSIQVAQWSVKLGKALGLSSEDVDELHLAGLLHDIGKIGIDSNLLRQKEPLTDAQWKQLYRHPETGFQILRSVQNFGRIADWVLMHHERLDGKGYPRGLIDSQIPLHAKIISVADAFDSMIHPKEYRKALTPQEAMKELRTYAGSQFDPIVVKTFISIYSDEHNVIEEEGE